MNYLYKRKIKTGQSVWGSLPRTTLPTEEARYPFFRGLASIEEQGRLEKQGDDLIPAPGPSSLNSGLCGPAALPLGSRGQGNPPSLAGPQLLQAAKL